MAILPAKVEAAQSLRWRDGKRSSCPAPDWKHSGRVAHGSIACRDCHGGREGTLTKAERTYGLVSDPSDITDNRCAACHQSTVDNVSHSLHSTMKGYHTLFEARTGRTLTFGSGDSSQVRSAVQQVPRILRFMPHQQTESSGRRLYSGAQHPSHAGHDLAVRRVSRQPDRRGVPRTA